MSVVDDLLGDTIAMRERGEEYIPRASSEKWLSRAYENRIRRAVLFSGFRDGVERIVSRPFSKDATFENVTDDIILDMQADVDRRGTSMTAFLASVFYAAVAYGGAHILVDYPETESLSADMRLSDGRPSLLAQRRRRLRPYFRFVHPRDVIGWRSETADDGTERLTQVRIVEVKPEDDGEFGVVERPCIRVITPDSIQLWVDRGDKATDSASSVTRDRGSDMGDGNWTLEEERSNPLGYVPLFTTYTRRIRFMEFLPPLEGLAHLNVAHWQLWADYREALHVASFAVLHRTGIDEHKADEPLQWGPVVTINDTNPEARAQFLELQGSALAAQVKAIEDVEMRMQQLGMQPLVEQSGSATATGKAIDAAKHETWVQAWVRDLEATANRALKAAHEFIGATMADDAGIDIYDQFSSMSLKSREELASLDAARARGDLSHEDYLREMQRRGVIADDADIDDLVERARNDMASALSQFGPPMQAAAEQGDTEDEDEQDDAEDDDEETAPVEEPADAAM
jgi:hypothetical protein